MEDTNPSEMYSERVGATSIGIGVGLALFGFLVQNTGFTPVPRDFGMSFLFLSVTFLFLAQSYGSIRWILHDGTHSLVSALTEPMLVNCVYFLSIPAAVAGVFGSIGVFVGVRLLFLIPLIVGGIVLSAPLSVLFLGWVKEVKESRENSMKIEKL